MPKMENGKPVCNCGWMLPDIGVELDPKDRGIAYTLWLRCPQCQATMCQTNEQSRTAFGIRKDQPMGPGY